MLLFVLIGVYFLFFTEKSSTFDSDENRMLAAAPSFAPANVWNGDISTETEDFLSDHAPFRKTSIRWSKGLKNLVSAASYSDTLAVMDKKDDALSSDELNKDDLDQMAQQIEQETQPPAAEPSDTSTPKKREKPPASADDYADTLYLKMNVNDDVVARGLRGLEGERGEHLRRRAEAGRGRRRLRATGRGDHGRRHGNRDRRAHAGPQHSPEIRPHGDQDPPGAGRPGAAGEGDPHHRVVGDPRKNYPPDAASGGFSRPLGTSFPALHAFRAPVHFHQRRQILLRPCFGCFPRDFLL